MLLRDSKPTDKSIVILNICWGSKYVYFFLFYI